MKDWAIIFQKLPPPPPGPPPPEYVLEQKRRQKKLITLVSLAVLVGGGVWAGLYWWHGAQLRAGERVVNGMRYSTPGNYTKALDEFAAAVRMDPAAAAPYFRRAQIYLQLGDLKAATQDLEAALQRKPDYVEALSALAVIHREHGERERAVEELTRAISISPTKDAYFQRGSTYQELGLHEQAIADFTWVIDQIRDSPFVYLARASSKRSLGDIAGAEQDELLAESFDRTSSLR